VAEITSNGDLRMPAMAIGKLLPVIAINVLMFKAHRPPMAPMYTNGIA
jgi:hypothetical protein